MTAHQPNDGVTCDMADDHTLITIARPPVNALDTKAVIATEAAFLSAPKNLPIILTGTGTSFCAGVDTRAYSGYSPDEKAELILAITRMIATILAHPAPVIAAVNGHALGGGLVFMLACDVRIVSDITKSRFGLTEARAGVPFPAGALKVVQNEVAPAVLRRLTLTSETISASDIMAHDLADAMCASDALLATALEIARDTASQPAFQEVKRQMRGDLIDAVAALAHSGEDSLAEMLRAQG